jgi:hypothetical protein
MLIYVVSLPIEPSFKLNIHNQCLDVDLLYPAYITDSGLVCYKAPDYKVCVGNTMRFSFIVYDPYYGPRGVLIYRLQRRQPHESTKVHEVTSGGAHLLVTWKIYELNKLYADILLVKHDKRLDKDELEKLYYKNADRFRSFSDSATETWSLGDNTALTIVFEIMNEDRTLDITISEVGEYNCAKMAASVDPER